MRGASDLAVGEIVVPVSDVRHLFVAPDVDPLAQHEGEVMGEPALLRVVRRLMAARRLGGAHKLVVQLPADKLEPDLEQRTRAAVARYCKLKIEDNDAQLRVMRREATGLLLRGMLILLVCMGLSALFTSETFTALPPLLSGTIGEGFNVIGWVMMWRPVEAYFFNPLPIKTSTRAHRFVQSLHVEVRPAAAPSRA
jgi:hypothetical protein